MRAVSDDRDLAESSGINVDRVIQITWILAAVLAALGGVFYGLNESVSYEMGFRILLLLFAAVVLGGLGTAYGVMAGAFVVGIVVEMSTLVLPAELKVVSGLVILIVMLLIRPQGIFGDAGEDRLMDWLQILAAGVLATIGPVTAGYALSAIGLNLQFGYAGLLNFGHVAFMLVGAYGVGDDGRVRGAAVAGAPRRYRGCRRARAPARDSDAATAGRLLRHHLDRGGRGASTGGEVVGRRAGDGRGVRPSGLRRRLPCAQSLLGDGAVRRSVSSW